MIIFKHPNILWFLLANIIPVILHLLNYRTHTTIYFSNVKMINKLYEKSKNFSNLKKWILLIIRILIISLIVLAFSQVSISNHKNQYNTKQISYNNVFLIFDNTISSSLNTKGETSLDKLKKTAISVVKKLDSHTNISIIDINNKYFNIQKANHAISYINKIKHSTKSKGLINRINSIKDRLNENSIVYIFSDYQKTSIDIKNLLNLNSPIVLSNTEIKNLENISIDSCYIKTENIIEAIITNHSEKERTNLSIKLEVNKQTKEIKNINLKANEKKQIRYKLNTKNSSKANISFNDSNCSFDNKLYFSINNSKPTEILCVNQSSENKFIHKLLNLDKQTNITEVNINQLSGIEISNYDMIILNSLEKMSDNDIGRIKKYCTKQKHISIIPSENNNTDINRLLSEMNLSQYSEKLDINEYISKAEKNSILYKNAYKIKNRNIQWPIINRIFKLKTQNKVNSENILKTNTDRTVIAREKYKNSYINIFTTRIDSSWTKLMFHPLFIPSIKNLNKESQNQTKLYYLVEDKIKIKLDKRLKNYNNLYFSFDKDNSQFKADKNQINENQEINISASNIKNFGNYSLFSNNAKILQLSFNHPSNESIMDFYKSNELSEFARENKMIKYLNPDLLIDNKQKQDKNSIELWQILLLTSLVLLIIEKSYFKHNLNLK
ncbi:MAG: BatA domain-containing protein [Marinifilaceae bacterium]|jgi:hypothetical protein|nr:BatA domain-containing protein [Marinifilaceae bacterium]